MTPEKNNSVKKEVNKAKSKVANKVFRVGLAASMIFGAPACVPTEAISIIPTGETNPLPSDSTKTPESPTEATYDITSTPGIESTINPPTELATLVTEELVSESKNNAETFWQLTDITTPQSKPGFSGYSYTVDFTSISGDSNYPSCGEAGKIDCAEVVIGIGWSGKEVQRLDFNRFFSRY